MALRQWEDAFFKIANNDALPTPSGTYQTSASIDLGDRQNPRQGTSEITRPQFSFDPTCHMLALRVFSNTLAVGTAFTRDRCLKVKVQTSTDGTTWDDAALYEHILSKNIINPVNVNANILYLPNYLERYIRVAYQRGDAGTFVANGRLHIAIVVLPKPSKTGV